MIGLAILAAAAAAPASYAGFYDGGQMEVSAALELEADGSFGYALSYGALDEQAQGRWVADKGGVRLVATRFDSNDPQGGAFPPVLLADEEGSLILYRHGLRLRFERPAP